MLNNRIRLTDRTIKALKPGHKVIDYPDALQTGLVIRVWPSGAKSWGARYWMNGKSVRTSLGSYPEIGLAKARKLAAEARGAKSKGDDPRDVLRPQRVPVTLHTTLKEAARRWLNDQRALGMKSADDRFRILELHVLPTLGDRAIEDIDRADVSRLLENLRDRHGLTAQVNRVHTTLSGIFTWALDAGLVNSHPMVRMRRKVAEGERSTKMTLDQLVTVWNSAGKISSIAGDITRLLILLPCRREEITQARWDELNLPGKDWHLPADRTKGKRDRTVPLPTAVVEIFERQPRWRGGDYVFSAQRGKVPFKGWKRAASMLRKEAAMVDASGEPLAWHVHDIRRSTATLMAGDPLRVPEETVARILAHSDRARRGVTARYDKNPRLGEVGDALRAWAEYFLSAVEGRGQVVELSRKTG
jgi:integrase